MRTTIRNINAAQTPSKDNIARPSNSHHKLKHNKKHQQNRKFLVLHLVLMMVLLLVLNIVLMVFASSGNYKA